MILTDKAKEDFEKWFEKEYRTFATSYGENVDKINNYIAIEWFDTVGIDIDINLFREKNEIGSKVYFKAFVEDEIVEYDFGFRYFFSRQEATIEAIKKANEIYNQKK